MKRLLIPFVSVAVIVGAALYGAGRAEAGVYACGPIAFFASSGSNNGQLQVYNPNAVTANVSVKFLNAAGTNLSGTAVPCGGCGENYPGETGANKVAVLSAATRIVKYRTPDGDATLTASDIAVVIRISSDQPVMVLHSQPGGGPHPQSCLEQ